MDFLDGIHSLVSDVKSDRETVYNVHEFVAHANANIGRKVFDNAARGKVA